MILVEWRLRIGPGSQEADGVQLPTMDADPEGRPGEFGVAPQEALYVGNRSNDPRR